MHRQANYITIVYLTVFIAGCSLQRQPAKDSAPMTYNRMLQQEFARINNYSWKVYCAADYYTYTFPADSQFRQNNISELNLTLFNRDFKTESTQGTATLIRQSPSQRLFLSCYHIFNYPDTLVDYYYRDDGTKTPFIAHLSIKQKQIQFVKKYNTTVLVDIAAFDKKEDITFLVAEQTNPDSSPELFRMQIIHPGLVKTGTQAYVTGFPAGYAMVTSGLLSKPFPDRPGKIMIDASFNKGYSGAPFFVVSPDCRCFRLAGIITSSASEQKNILVPEFQSHRKIYNPRSIYTHPSFVKLDESIKYGITYTTSITTIKDFYINHQHTLNEKNISLEEFFHLER